MNNNDDFITIFEEKLCKYTGSPYAVVVDRCTNAIVLCLEYKKEKQNTIDLPKQTYMSVPMTLINYGYKIALRNIEWQEKYQIGNTRIYDYAVGFQKNMYVSGQIQCLRLAIGKGGAILLDDKNMYEKLKRMRHDGRTTHIGTNEDILKNSNDIMIGYHMNMSPEEASKGILLLNQLNENYTLGSYKDYIDLSNLNCLKEYCL